MVAVRAYYDGQVFVPESPFKAEVNQKAIVTILDGEVSPSDSPEDRVSSFADNASGEDHGKIRKTLEDIRNGDIPTPHADSLLGILAHVDGDISMEEIREERLAERYLK